MDAFAGTELHSLHWDNFDPAMLSAHKSVIERFGIPLQYTERNVHHDRWLDEVAKSSTADVFGFIEPDLVPLRAGLVEEAIAYVREHQTFLGCAQISNHIGPPLTCMPRRRSS